MMAMHLGFERSTLFSAKSIGEPGWTEACIPLPVHAGDFQSVPRGTVFAEERGHSSPANRFGREPKMFHVEQS